MVKNCKFWSKIANFELNIVNFVFQFVNFVFTCLRATKCSYETFTGLHKLCMVVNGLAERLSAFTIICMRLIASTKFVGVCTTYCAELIALEQTLVAFPEWYLHM